MTRVAFEPKAIRSPSRSSVRSVLGRISALVFRFTHLLQLLTSIKRYVIREVITLGLDRNLHRDIVAIGFNPIPRLHRVDPAVIVVSQCTLEVPDRGPLRTDTLKRRDNSLEESF